MATANRNLTSPSRTSTSSLIEVEGLKTSYTPCSLIKFSVHNVSSEDLFLEAYVERFDSNSWNEEKYPYAINDPGSLYRKAVRADRIKPRASMDLSYDRCLKPKFVKGNRESYKRRIEETDKAADDAGTPTIQRIRIEVRFRDSEAKVEKEWSEPFKRVAEKSPEVK